MLHLQMFSSHIPVSPFGCRCVKTYEVEFSKDGVIFQRINFRDTVFTSYTFSPGKLYYFIHTHTHRFQTAASQSRCSKLTKIVTWNPYQMKPHIDLCVRDIFFLFFSFREPGCVWIVQSERRRLLGTSRTVLSY